jgi:pSer/pThr/pTyr-binding forkhead associated (FHA) protein
VSAVSVRAASASELKDELEAERGGVPFLVYRELDGRRRIVLLGADRDRLTIGRRADNDVAITWDPQVSRVHAEFERIGLEWTVTDEGLSRNGSFINGERLLGRRRLRDGDAIGVGETTLVYRTPAGQTDPTMVPVTVRPAPVLSETQRRVLLALARPCAGAGLRTPATNRDIARELNYSVEAVKGQLRVLFHKFGVDDLPQNQKRLALVDAALKTGAISRRELAGR